jgi:endonuclease YncB( thermonuclease family)
VGETFKEISLKGDPMKKCILSLALMMFFFLPPLSLAGSRGATKGGGYRSYRGAKAIDGDTFRYKGQRYRLRDYDAPERGQRGDKEATESLQRRLNSGSYQYKSVGRDVYGRPIVEEKRGE